MYKITNIIYKFLWEHKYEKKNIPEVVEGAKVVGATVTIGAETQDDNSKLLNILNIIKQYLSLPKFSQH